MFRPIRDQYLHEDWRRLHRHHALLCGQHDLDHGHVPGEHNHVSQLVRVEVTECCWCEGFTALTKHSSRDVAKIIALNYC